MSSSRVTTNRVLVCGLVATVLSACGHDPVRQLPTPDAASETRVTVPKVKRRSPGEEAAVIALRQIGVPYRYGGSTVHGFDCSGLVHFAYANAGKKIPRTTTEQWRQLSPIESDDLRVGDLLFFRIDGKVSHVGMYVGDRRFVHAPAAGRKVSTASLDSDFYRRALVRAARPD